MLRSITDHDSSFETLFAVKDAILYLAKLLETVGDTYQANLLYENFAGEGGMGGEILNSLGCALFLPSPCRKYYFSFSWENVVQRTWIILSNANI